MEAHVIVGFRPADRPHSLDDIKRFIPNAVHFTPVDDPFNADAYFFDVTVTQDVTAKKPVERKPEILDTKHRKFFDEP